MERVEPLWRDGEIGRRRERSPEDKSAWTGLGQTVFERDLDR